MYEWGPSNSLARAPVLSSDECSAYPQVCLIHGPFLDQRYNHGTAAAYQNYFHPAGSLPCEAIRKMSHQRAISFDELSHYFRMPEKEVAKHLGESNDECICGALLQVLLVIFGLNRAQRLVYRTTRQKNIFPLPDSVFGRGVPYVAEKDLQKSRNFPLAIPQGSSCPDLFTLQDLILAFIWFIHANRRNASEMVAVTL